LSAQNVLYIYVGQQGYKNISNYTFNGGGIAANQYNARGWGGASDVRLAGADWNNFNSLKSRLMVAAGGGGSDYFGGALNGSPGGGVTGYNGGAHGTPCRGYSHSVATGGTQTAGGQGGWGTSVGFGGFGGFGVGGCANYNHGGGGGSGYYGGGNGGYTCGRVGSGAGGSSFISGHSGCNAISAASTSSNIVHTGQPNHYSGLFFTNTSMTAGARAGHGQVRITPLN